jgi:putative ABC transport system substrate-binding protein
MAIQIGRRELIVALGSAAAWPFVARAQQSERTRRINVVVGYAEGDIETSGRMAAFRRRLHDLGWTEGRNVQIEEQFTGADPDRIQAAVADVVSRTPDVILTSPGQVALVLKKATSTIPVVFANVPDPVGIGLVSSLARPGGNITGFTSIEPTLAGKWLEVLKELAPPITRAVVIYSPVNPAWSARLRVLEMVAPSLRVELKPAPVRSTAEIERAVEDFARDPNGGVILFPSVFTSDHRGTVIAAAARHQLPALYPYHAAVTEGGLASYGIDVADQFRGAASYVDRILKGEKPTELPVQAPTKYELVINLKTARALGLDVPPTLLSTADEVIE